MKLYLDDFRPCPVGWDVVRSYDAFVAYITENGMPDEISFDHDLGYISPDGEQMLGLDGTEIDPAQWTEKTGYDCAKWLIEHYGVSAKFAVHSMNPVGRKRIEDLLLSPQSGKDIR